MLKIMQNRKAKRVFVLWVIGFSLFIGGCSDSTSVSVGKARQDKATGSYCYPSLVNPKIATNDAIARVNGVPITRGEYDAWMALRDEVYCLSKKLDPTKRQDKVLAYRKTTRETAFFDLIRREILRQESERRGIAPVPEAIEAGKRKFLKGINSKVKSFDDFAASLPSNVREVLPRLILSDVRDELLLKDWVTNDVFTVSDLEVSNRLEYVHRYRQEIETRNAQAKQRAAEAKAEILAGASFYSVTTNRADVFKDQGREWDTVELGELDEDSDLFRFLTTAQAGDISDPIDFDDGIGIVGVLVKELGETPDGVAPSMQYTLVRCVFNAYVDLEEPEEFEAMRKHLLERKLAAAREGLVRELASKAKIEMPYGNALFIRKSVKKGGGKGNRKAGSRKAKAKKKE